MDHISPDEDGIAIAQSTTILFQPLLNLSLNNVDNFFLIRVFVEIVAFARHQIDLDDDQILGAGA